MVEEIETKFKEKFCPLLKKKCIGYDCAFYDEAYSIKSADNPYDDFTFCSISYLPLVFYELTRIKANTEK